MAREFAAMTAEQLARLWHAKRVEVWPHATDGWSKPFDDLKPENQQGLIEIAERVLSDWPESDGR